MSEQPYVNPVHVDWSKGKLVAIPECDGKDGMLTPKSPVVHPVGTIEKTAAGMIQVSLTNPETLPPGTYVLQAMPVLTVQPLSDAERQRLEESIRQQWANPDNRGRIFVAPAGAKIEPLSVPDSAQNGTPPEMPPVTLTARAIPAPDFIANSPMVASVEEQEAHRQWQELLMEVLRKDMDRVMNVEEKGDGEKAVNVPVVRRDKPCYLSLAEEKTREPHKPRSWLDETMGSGHPAPDPVPMTATWHGSAIKLQDARWFGWSECDGRMRCAGYFRSPYWNFKGGVLVRLRNESNYDEFWASVWPSGHGEHQFLGVDEVDEEAARTYLRDWRQAIPSLSPAPSEKAAPDKDSPTADAPQFITAPDEQQRCCLLLDGTVESRCLNRTRYWVGKNGVDDYTHCCEQHLEEVFRPGDAIQDMQTGMYLDALAAQWSSVAPAENKSKDSPPADTPEPDHTVNFREFL